LELSGQLTGSGALTKAGNGTLTLSGNDAAYTGAVTVNAGAVLVNGTLGTSGVTVNTGATIGGTGTIAGNLTFVGGGTIAPGSSPGTISLNSTGSLVFDPGSTLAFELNGGNTTEGAGVNDLIDDVAALTLDGTLNVSDSPNPGSFATATAGSSWRLINYSGALSDMGLTLGTMPTLAMDHSFVIDTSTAGQVNLLITAIPEASAFLFGGLVASVVAGRVAMKRLRRKA
jgi:autotransporter-associated beta strand protein